MDNSDKSVGKRKPGTFTPGNPGGGRKKVPPELRAMFEAAAPEAVQLLIAMLSDRTAKHADRIKAAEIILDRHLGKPMQAVQHEGDVGLSVILMAPGQYESPDEWEAATER